MKHSNVSIPDSPPLWLRPLAGGPSIPLWCAVTPRAAAILARLAGATAARFPGGAVLLLWPDGFAGIVEVVS